jgi:eukaryotic-like serine/threonine-protein kinase
MYQALSFAYIVLNRIEEAKATIADALAKNLDSPNLHTSMFLIAFLDGDSAAMAKQVDWARGQPGIEDGMLSNDGGAKAYSGRLAKARDLLQRAADSAVAQGEKEVAANYIGSSATRDALAGDLSRAQQEAAATLALSKGRDAQAQAALAYAFANDSARAQALADDLAKRFPQDTLVQSIYLPITHSQIALNHSDPAKALEALAPYEKYDLGQNSSLTQPYVRGTVRLAQRKGPEAAADFKKVLDNRNLNPNDVIVPLSQLGLARAYVLSGDTSKARTAYQDFLATWKDADPDIPILKQAKSEYAKLQ